MEIRIAALDDAAAIADLAAKTFLDYFGAANEPQHIQQYLSEAFSLAQIEKELTDPNSAFLIACQRDARAGYAKLRKASAPPCVTGPKPVELERIYVDRPYLGTGVGGMLMKAVTEQARELDGETLWLGVWDKNLRAQSFYRKYGFEEVGTKVFMLGPDRQTDVVMTLSI